MGQPKRIRRKYDRPKKPYDKERIDREKKIMETYGLRRKRELWRAEGIVRDYRRRARDLQAREDKEQEKVLLEKLNKIGIKCEKLDDVLNIGVDDILLRRLQTVIQKKGIANTVNQARQFIVHGHVLIDDRKVVWPSFIVEKGTEEKITLNQTVASKVLKEDTKRAEEARELAEKKVKKE